MAAKADIRPPVDLGVCDPGSGVYPDIVIRFPSGYPFAAVHLEYLRRDGDRRLPGEFVCAMLVKAQNKLRVRVGDPNGFFGYGNVRRVGLFDGTGCRYVDAGLRECEAERPENDNLFHVKTFNGDGGIIFESKDYA